MVRGGPGRAFGFGALGAAVLSAACCVGPLLLAIAGLGGGAVFLSVAPFRPYFIGLSVLLLAAAFSVVYRPRGPAECEGTCPPRASKRHKVFLWIVAAIVIVAAADLMRSAEVL